jgi:hypothetical protein
MGGYVRYSWKRSAKPFKEGGVRMCSWVMVPESRR